MGSSPPFSSPNRKSKLRNVSPPNSYPPAFQVAKPGQEFPRALSKGFTGETWYDYDLPLSRTDPICILHFNDVYNVEPSEDGNGGVSRFITALREFHPCHPLTLFSGDTFNPSRMSTHTRGRHMIPFLNMCKIHTACFGNHDFDFGVDAVEFLSGSTRFPWLMSNVFDKDTGDPLGNGHTYRLFEWQGVRVGIIGLVERDWLETLACVDLDDVEYRDFIEEAERLCTLLRTKEAELIIALTHMRAPNDERLAREASDIDLILGGHDHEYYGAIRICDTVVVKSGCDFREFSALTIHPGTIMEIPDVDYDIHNPPPGILKPGNRGGGRMLLPKFMGGSTLEFKCVEVKTELFTSNRHVDIMVGRYMNDIQANVNKILIHLDVPLETRFTVIRTSESNAGNWFCDLMRTECKSDFALLNSGTIRSDCVFQPGSLTLGNLSSMLPMPDPLVVIGLIGSKLLEILENSVSKYPQTEGRFLQVSGFSFAFDPSQLPGNRILKDSVKVLDGDGTRVKLDLEHTYTATTKEYIAQGKDGYDMCTSCEVLREAELTPDLPTMVRNSMTMAAMANGYKRPHTKMTTKRLQTFCSLTAASMLRESGCRKEPDGSFSLAPIIDGRIRNIRVTDVSSNIQQK